MGDFSKDKDWRYNIQPGDEIRIDTGDNEIGPSIIVLEIEYPESSPDSARITTDEGERIECLIEEIL